MESYLKFTFSKQILVFAIAWMGTRDIYVAFMITLVFVLIMEFLCNEESQFCWLPEQFKTYHIELLENEENEKKEKEQKEKPDRIFGDTISEEDIKMAKEILKKSGLKYIEDPDGKSPVPSFISGSYSPFII